MNKAFLCVSALAALAFTGTLHAQVPNLINYQGRVAVTGTNFDGSGQFRFALVNTSGTTTYWSNDGTSVAGSQPAAAVALSLTKGLYSVLLGDTSLAGMAAIPADVWTHPDVRLRVWFDDGTINGSQLLTPDQRIAPSAYLADGSVTSAKIASNAVGPTHIAAGAVGSAQLAPNLALTGTVTAPAFAGNGSGLTNVPAATLGGLGTASFWQLGGNAGSTPGVSFLGTTDNQPLELKVNNQRVLRLELGTDNPNVTLGSNTNLIAAGSTASTIAGGNNNTIETSVSRSFIGAGLSNTIQSGAFWNFIGGGNLNVIQSGANRSVIGGGRENTIGTNASYATVPGGFNNTASGFVSFAAGRRAKANHSGAFVWADDVDADFVSTGGEQFLIRALGGVGIGKNNPQAQLDVAGNALFSGNVGIGTLTPASKLHLRDESIPTSLGAGGVITIAGADVGSGPNVKKEILFKTWGNSPTAHGIIGIETVNAAGAEAGDLYFATKNGIGNIAPTEKLRITNGGNVGIGTINPQATLDVAGNALVNGKLSIPGANAVDNGSPGIILLHTDTDDFLYQGEYLSNYGFGFLHTNDVIPNGPNAYISSYFGMDFFTGSFNRLHIDLAGRVGIGTTAPTATLDVAGTIKASAFTSSNSVGIGTSTPNAQLEVASSSAVIRLNRVGTGLFDFGVSAITGGDSSADLFVTPGQARSGIVLRTTDSGGAIVDALRLDRNGNVGIGTTTPNLSGDKRALTVSAGTSGDYIARLEVQGTRSADNIYGALDFYHKANNTASIESYRTGADDAGNLTFWTKKTGVPLAERMRIDNSGNVGIGTTEPGQKLDVNGAIRVLAGNAISFNNAANTGVASLYFDGSELVTDRRFWIESGGLIVNSGNVGIGTATPSAKLEVVGNLKVSGTGNMLITPVLSITGGSDVAEPFDIAGGDIPEGSVVVIDETSPGHLKRSDQPYDTRVAGIVSGAGGVNPGLTLSQQGVMEGSHKVALVGRVYARADATDHPIHPGDLLTTSSTPGHVMRATDRDRAQGAILGKAMTSLESGTGLVLVLVTLQ